MKKFIKFKFSNGEEITIEKELADKIMYDRGQVFSLTEKGKWTGETINKAHIVSTNRDYEKEKIENERERKTEAIKERAKRLLKTVKQKEDEATARGDGQTFGAKELEAYIKNGFKYPDGSKVSQKFYNMKAKKGNSIKGKWYKMPITKKEWEDFYSKLSYTRLENFSGEIFVGFFAINKESNYLNCSDEDLQKIQTEREAQNIYPQPFKKLKIN